jgi:heptosyltransferase-2
MKYKNALIIQTAFLGDVILATSLLEKLHRYNPEMKISILVKKGMGSLFEDHPFLTEVLEMEKRERNIKSLWQWISIIRKKKFDLVVNAHRYLRTGIIAAFSGARHIAGYKENPVSFLFNHTGRFRIGDGTHEVERLNQLVNDFTGEDWMKPRLYPGPKHFAEVEHLIKIPYVCFAPGSVWKTKQLPVEKWVALGKKISKKEKIYFIGSKEDEGICQQIKKELVEAEAEILCGRLSLLGTACLIQHARMNYVNDSAPLHIASAMNAPVTAFFCSTVPEFGFYPLSDQNKIIQVKELYCRPCGIHGKKACPEKHFRCGKEIDINTL